jgi:hypothetical protein
MKIGTVQSCCGKKKEPEKKDLGLVKEYKMTTKDK